MKGTVYALVKFQADDDETAAERLEGTGITLLAQPTEATATAWLDDYRGQR